MIFYLAASRKRALVNVPENGRRKAQKVTTSEDCEEDLEGALQSHFEGTGIK